MRFYNYYGESPKIKFEELYGLGIENYLTNPINYQNFSDVGQIHALSFLERYCMNYEDVKDVKKKYVKTL